MKNVRCDHCGKIASLATGAVNRARKNRRRIFCGSMCAGRARRTDSRTDAQKRADKAEYDRNYRHVNGALLKEKKAAYYRENRERIEAKTKPYRKANMARHVAYCRAYYADPKRKSEKVAYDAERRSRLQYGYWKECHRLYVELCKEIRRLIPNQYERMKARGYEFNKATNRRRACGITRN